jgi:hypothetical protein
MRQPHCTITPATVRSTARLALQRALPWEGYGELVPARRLLELLLLVAALRQSLSAVVRRFRFGFSHETARQAVRANLPEVGPLTEGLADSLHLLLRPRLKRKRVWDVAIDLHHCPFYGDRRTKGIVGGQKKHGSKYHYAYATCVLVHWRHRYTVGLLALDGSLKPHQVVQALLDQVASRGLRLRGVVLDSGFDSGETILLLQGRGLSYSVPLKRKGKGNNRRNACFALPLGTVTTVEWVTEKSRREVSTEAVVLRRKGEKEVKVYAFGGWGPEGEARVRRRARLAKRAYRRRLGIETSYRQLNEAKGKTTKKDVCYRLLLVGLALLLRQVWVWLTMQPAKSRKARPTQWLGELPLPRMLGWLADVLKGRYKESKAIDLRQPLLPLDRAS